MTWVILIRLLAGCWSLAGALDVISPVITEFGVGNHCCYELGEHTIALHTAAASRWALPGCTKGPPGMVGVAGPIRI